MNLARLVGLLLVMGCARGACGAAGFAVRDGAWMHGGRPFYSTTAHAIFHHFREDRESAILDLKELKKAGFSVVEVYWQWGKDLDPATNTFSFGVFDDFIRECNRIGLYTFCMFQEYIPIWLADKLGWGHTSEEGNRDLRIDDFYVCNPSFKAESKRFYTALVEHLAANPEISKSILYFNMGGEYKPFRPNRQPKPLDYGYDDFTVGAFRGWLAAKGWSPADVEKRWGAPGGAYRTWEDVWPAISMKETDYKARPLSEANAARWDWFEFRQEVASQHMAEAVRWLREAGEKRPLIHEYNTVIPGGLPLFLDWSRVGARSGRDGIYTSTGTFDREFDYPSLLSNLAIARGASDPPWQSNEQKGNTSPEWMIRHAWMLIAMGGTGVHFWEWRGDDWGVLKKDRSPSEGYAAAVRVNARIEFLGDLLKSSRPMPNRIGLLAIVEESLYAPYAHDRERNAVLQALLESGSGVEVATITEDQVLNHGLDDYRLIISTGQVRMRQAVREKLAEFVRRGGSLWLTPGSASKDEADRATAVNPGAPLDKAAGVQVTGDREVAVGRLFMGKAPSAPFAVLECTTKASTAKPVAYLDSYRTGEPAIWRNAYGKGICYFQAAGTAYPPSEDTPLTRDTEALRYYVRSNSGQLPRELLAGALSEQGIEPYAKPFEWHDYGETQLRDFAQGRAQAARPTYKPLRTVITGIRRADPGYLLFLIEGDNRFADARIELNAKRLGLKGEWVAYAPETLEQQPLRTDGFGAWAVRVGLKPAEVKLLHLVPRAQVAKWIAHYGAKDWTGIVAKLPPIPAKRLAPPSEAGKVDPGDLRNVRPKPHGDRWLLVDLSRHANRSLVDEGRQENAKAFLGSVGVGDNDLSELPKGLNEFLGVPYDILDPAAHTNSCLITKTSGRPWLGPLEFAGIPVREKVKKIHWLYGTGWAPFDLPVGYITYHYSDGTRDQENLICGRNIMNWWGRAEHYESPGLRLAWSGNTPAARRNYTTVGLYHYAWENPHPEKTVESIDIASYGGDACLIVVAVTGEK